MAPGLPGPISMSILMNTLFIEMLGWGMDGSATDRAQMWTTGLGAVGSPKPGAAGARTIFARLAAPRSPSIWHGLSPPPWPAVLRLKAYSSVSDTEYSPPGK
ncbi:MAG: hypothetical protein BWZ10_03507 [candidate division BRC1 bacterium ADurb.BinA364]|nr:MAG: hypothetical protein BWZ10_03507 [candidate division BRC1 bacterium ADurb.BinA364]